ncbi:MAG: delta-60 repeat domain-containing protein [Bacteroidota bacterium]
MKTRRAFWTMHRAALAASLLVAVLTSTVALGAPGALDASFSGDGKVIASIGANDFGNALALQPNGKILVAGKSFSGSSDDFALARFSATGALDASFDGDGRLTTAFGSGPDEAYAMALQPDGRIVVAGSTYAGSQNRFDFALARYESDGRLDQSFGINGKITTDLGGDDKAYGVGVQTDGRIIAAGYSTKNDADFALVRYDSQGNPDVSFGRNGRVVTDLGGDDGAYALVIQPDGRILAAGETTASGSLDFALVRYAVDGNPDATFDGDGMVATSFGPGDDYGRALALQGDGKIVVAGAASIAGSVDFALARYNLNGSPDAGFSGDGKVTTSFGAGDDIGRAVLLQPDGKIIAAGSAFNGTNKDFAVARYLANGSPDMNFHFEGNVTATFGGNDDTGSAAALQPDAKIIVAGTTSNGTGFDLALARFLGGSSKSFSSAGAYDGWTLESSETSGQGGSANAVATTFKLGDDAMDRQFRSILSFNTTTLPDNAVITRVTLKMHKQSQGGDQNPFSVLGQLLVDIRRTYFGRGIGLEPRDFQGLASRNGVGIVVHAPGGGSLYTATLSPAAYPYVNLAGTTQFRLRFARDDNDDMSADYIGFFSGNYATASLRPQLIVDYYIPQ